MISLARIDSRLIHGQVIEAWLPHLAVRRILVLDDDAAANPLTRAAMGLAVPGAVAVSLRGYADGRPLAEEATDPLPTLLLVRDVAAAVRAREAGLGFASLNLGNLHYRPGRLQVTPSVFLAPEELVQLRELVRQGVSIELRAVPRDRPLTLHEIETRLGGAAAPP